MKIEEYLRASPVFTLNLVFDRVVNGVNQKLNAERVNLLQGLILTALVFEENSRISPSELARVFQTSRANISHAISDLEYKGLVSRSLSKEDARKFFIGVKPEGRKTAYRLIKFFDRLQDTFESKLGATQCKKAMETLHSLAEIFQREF